VGRVTAAVYRRLTFAIDRKAAGYLAKQAASQAGPTDMTNPSTPQVTHGPRAAKRIPPGEYTPDFLERLKAQGKVFSVAPDWNHDTKTLPPEISWVLYPNGDLERVGS
jgi:hypothetical protein